MLGKLGVVGAKQEEDRSIASHSWRSKCSSRRRIKNKFRQGYCSWPTYISNATLGKKSIYWHPSVMYRQIPNLFPHLNLEDSLQISKFLFKKKSFQPFKCQAD